MQRVSVQNKVCGFANAAKLWWQSGDGVVGDIKHGLKVYMCDHGSIYACVYRQIYECIHDYVVYFNWLNPIMSMNVCSGRFVILVS